MAMGECSAYSSLYRRNFLFSLTWCHKRMPCSIWYPAYKTTNTNTKSEIFAKCHTFRLHCMLIICPWCHKRIAVLV